jgi:tetratricopeptide (TPR) repeat protein
MAKVRIKGSEEAGMQRLMILIAILLSVSATASAQIGKSVVVSAGTPEDKALTEIYAAPDGPEKVALLDKFMADFGKGDMELLGDQLYVQTYLAQKNYAKVYEYAAKALALDPTNLSAAVSVVHAAEGQGDVKKLYDAGDKVAEIIAQYKNAPPPEGTAPDQWTQQKTTNLANVQGDIGYVQYALVTAAYKITDPTARAALFERYVTDFPDSQYTPAVREQTAIAYQQAQQIPKMLDTAQRILAADPNNISMLLLLSDYWTDNGQQLDKAVADAQQALDLLAQAKKPDNLSDDQWQQQVTVEKGLAYSAIGEANVNKGRFQPAVDSFKQASPLLKSNTVAYARNLYRLGFTLAKMERFPEARTVLNEAVSINSPYKSKAQETLNKINGTASGKTKGKSS